MKKKKKVKERPKRLIRQRQKEDCYITLIRKGRIIVRDGELVKK